MKFKLGCASAVLMFLCFDATWGGALKKHFMKNKASDIEQNEGVKSDKESHKAEDVAAPAKQDNSAAKEDKTQKQEAPKEKKEIKGNPVIYRIGNKEIHRDEILEDIKSLPPALLQQASSDKISSDKIFDLVKRQKLMIYLVVEQAKKAGMDREKEFIKQIERIKERVLFENYLLKELGPKASNEKALDDKYKTYLLEFKSEKEIKLSTIALSTEKEAKEIIEALKKGAPFDKLQREKGLGSSERGDQYMPVAAIPEEFKKKFKSIAKNEIAEEPVKIMEAYHVLKIADMRDSKPGKPEEVKPILSRMILKEEVDKLVDRLEKQYNVQKFNEDGTPEVAAPNLPKIDLTKPPAAPAA